MTMIPADAAQKAVNSILGSHQAGTPHYDAIHAAIERLAGREFNLPAMIAALTTTALYLQVRSGHTVSKFAEYLRDCAENLDGELRQHCQRGLH